MSQSFSYDLSLPGSPADCQNRIKGSLTEQLRQTAKMRLAGQDSNSLSFRPQWSWPVLAALFRMVGGEAIKVTFTAANGGTSVTVAGKVGGDGEKVANRDFWAQTLGAAD
jgi:hypothetical protein